MNNSLKSFIRRNVFALRRNNIYKSYQLQKKIRYLEYSEIKRLQNHRLRKIISYAYDNSSFYRRYFDTNGLKPEDINNSTDFEALPSINKVIMKTNFKDILISNNFGRIEDFTSGSTGEPFKFFKDVRNELPLEQAAYMLFKEGVGINPFNSGNILMIKTYPKNRIRDYRDIELNLVYKGLFQKNYFGISISDIRENNIDFIIDVIEKREVRIIYGYSQSIVNLVDIFKKIAYKPRIDYVIGIAEDLIDSQKKEIISYLNCKVVMDYGSSECMRIGFECNKGVMHLDIFRYYVNIVDSQGLSGKSGNAIVTNLNNFVFPFINYEIGDSMVLSHEECACGCSFPIIEKIGGRSSNSLIDMFGNNYASTYFVVIFEFKFEFISRFQMIQTDINNVTVKIVPTVLFHQEILNELYLELDNITKGNFIFNIDIVEYIEIGKSGKYEIIKPLAKEVINKESFSKNIGI